MTTGAAAHLELERITRRFAAAGAPALDDVSLRVERGAIVALLGPSGCGKSTTLRVIAGLETPDSGDVRVDGASILRRPPERRAMGVVFQNYALFPHLSVRENVAFGLRARGAAREDTAERVAQALRLVQLEGYDDRGVDKLSGGQQQRVALARAIALGPEILLLDEPLSNLDAALRDETRDSLRALVRKLGVTAVFVTHDQADALAFADQVALMRAGRIVETGTPADLFFRPESAFCATFLAGANVLAARADGDGRHATIEASGAGGGSGAAGAIRLEVGSWAGDLERAPAGAPVALAIRPDAIRVARAEAVDPTGAAGGAAGGEIRARVLDRVFFGSTTRLRLELAPGVEVRALSPAPPDGENVRVRIDPGSVRALPPDGAHAGPA